MATEIIIPAVQSAVLIRNDYTYKDTTSAIARIGSVNGRIVDERILFVNFGRFPDDAKYKLISSAAVYIYFRALGDSYGVHPFWYDWPGGDIYAESAGELLSTAYRGSISNGISVREKGYAKFYSPRLDSNFQNYGGAYYVGSDSRNYQSYADGWADVDTINGENPPYLSCIVSDTDYHLTADKVSPSGGYIDDRKQNIFTISTTANGTCLAPEDFRAASTFTLHIKASSWAAEYTYNAPGGTCTLPAGALPTTGTVMIYGEVVDALGYRSMTNWYSYSTSDTVPVATPITPDGTIESIDAPVHFEWTHSNASGSAQTAAQIDVSNDAQTIARTFTVSGSATSADISLNGVLNGGEAYWSVRTANTDGIYSEWSYWTQFTLVAPPQVSYIITSGSYQPTVTWQAEDQQAYEVELEGLYSSGVQFGSSKSYLVPLVLDAGSYIARVRVQNSLGLWSEWASVALTISSPMTETLTLTASADEFEAHLTWTARTGSTYLIYRDGELVGKTTDAQFNDLTAVGTVTYKIISYRGTPRSFTASNAVSVDVTPSCTALCLPDGYWLPLRYSQRLIDEQIYADERAVTYRHFSGSEWPVAEWDDKRGQAATVEAALRDPYDIRRLRNMVGRSVIFKSPDRCFAGALSRLDEVSNMFYKVFNITVTRTAEEAITP